VVESDAEKLDQRRHELLADHAIRAPAARILKKLWDWCENEVNCAPADLHGLSRDDPKDHERHEEELTRTFRWFLELRQAGLIRTGTTQPVVKSTWKPTPEGGLLLLALEKLEQELATGAAS
jgi:hypothetical protein